MYIKRQIWESAKFQVARNIESTKIPEFANFFNFDSFPNWKNSENLLIFQLRKFLKFLIHNIPYIGLAAPKMRWNKKKISRDNNRN